MAGEPRKPRIRPRRIIERPHLIRALDRSDARVRLLVAGPGYGKTTLAEQWAARDGLRVGWFRARRSAADVTVVARGIVTAVEVIVPGAGSRLLQRLAVTNDPEREAVLLAEMLAEDLEAWPDRAWIVVDDYEHLATSVASEVFVETVVSRSAVRFLLAGAVRPRWVAPSDILVGDVLELPERALAMTIEEATRVLDGSRRDQEPGLVALSDGSPSLIGLAGMTPEAGDPESDLESLFDFFAEELYRGLDPTVRTGLTILAEMPLVDRDLAAAVLDADRAAAVCNEAVRLGILDQRGGFLEFHSLVRSFFARRLDKASAMSDLWAQARAHYRGRGELDAAFELTEKVGEPGDVDELVSDSMRELLDRARLPTLESWVARAATRVGETPAVRLAQAEIALRQGRHLTAQVISEGVIRDADDAIVARAYLVAAKAAHVGLREEDALALYREAEMSTQNDAERREAQWGQLTAAIELELDLSHELLRGLERRVKRGIDPTEAVQTADKRLLLGLRFGRIPNLAEAKEVDELLPAVPDPVLRCSFGSTFSCALNLAADYRRALDVSKRMTQDASEYRVDFALPYGLLMSAAALAGLRSFAEAHDVLSTSFDHAVRCADPFGQQAVYAGRVRAFLHAGRISDACALEPPDLSHSLPAMRGEVWGSRGLALACMGRLPEARECAALVTGQTRAVEPTMLVLCIRAVAALKAREQNVDAIIHRLVEACFEAGAVDFVITSYRASPDLLAALLSCTDTAEPTAYIVTRGHDNDLAESMGLDTLAAHDPVSTLSPREREVYDLLCQGLSNSEIAGRLYISPATAKVHVRHVYDKLGIRSRTALALSAASRRFQAAPTETSANSSSSEVEG
jgi:DNA-binding NarL/FixJ family response regulator/tetratricopeptide (TPR) repeat protein